MIPKIINILLGSYIVDSIYIPIQLNMNKKRVFDIISFDYSRVKCMWYVTSHNNINIVCTIKNPNVIKGCDFIEFTLNKKFVTVTHNGNYIEPSQYEDGSKVTLTEYEFNYLNAEIYVELY